MSKPSLNQIRDIFTKLVFPFYEIEREMDIPLIKRRKENDAEHSWALSLVACALAQRIDPSLDLGKIAQLVIVHDLVEVFAGDTSIWDSQSLATKPQREKKALAKLEKDFKAFPWVGQMSKEYEAKASPEARFIWAVDKFVASFERIMDLEQGGRFFIDERPMTLPAFQQGIEATRRKAHAHKEVGDYYDQLMQVVATHPEWFAKA